MLQYDQLKCRLGYTKEDIAAALSEKLNIPISSISSVKILRESLDARKKSDIFYILKVAFKAEQEDRLISYINKKNKKYAKLSVYHEKTLKPLQLPEKILKAEKNPIIIGAGPAGLFCAYFLAKAGLKPLLLERGKSVDERTKDVSGFWENGRLFVQSNVQFGEGGAGAFSDGKLNTLNKDPLGYQKEVLKLFVKMGAKESILYEQKPHLGTDCLLDIVRNMRNAILKLGGQIRFDSQVTDFIFNGPRNEISGVVVNGKETVSAKRVVLAIGHSARDTFRTIYDSKLAMEPKSFAVGYRVQHLQSDIDKSQYGKDYVGKLPPASYKLTAKSEAGRGVYSFCMCPGGYVVNASSEDDRLCVNGMSYSDRNGPNANSAIIVSVTPKDFDGDDALAGIRFQEKLEQKAYRTCGGKIPLQTLIDFKKNITSSGCGRIQPEVKGQYDFANLRGIYDTEIEEAFLDGMKQFGKKIPCFDADDVLLAGIESRTSSPVRIVRDDSCQAVGIRGLYPCGEGAGYAGGIMSAACDGIKVAIKLMEAIAAFI